jgi:hypothetical protein
MLPSTPKNGILARQVVDQHNCVIKKKNVTSVLFSKQPVRSLYTKIVFAQTRGVFLIHELAQQVEVLGVMAGKNILRDS